MKVIKQLLEEDNMKIVPIITNEILADDVNYYVDFIPRKVIDPNIEYDYITVDNTLITVDNTDITADLTFYTIPVPSTVEVVVIREFDNKSFKPEVEISLYNNIYRLIFLTSDFLTREGRYSILIKDENDTLYKGKMIYTLKDIQNYRYTTINNDKMYL